MALANPAINPPRLPSPTKRSLHSRSPSRSPVRHHARDFDPLLRDLSPTTTLRAFSAPPDETPNGHASNGIESASGAERRLGVKAAQACADVRAWARELESWEWPGTFETPEPARKKQRLSMMSVSSVFSRRTASLGQIEDGPDDYWGSLTSRTVQEYEKRTDEITEELDEIDVEELKGFVLAAHNRAGTGEANIDDSIGTIGAATDLKRLDDFTALITATILQALPYLSRLTRLLNTWTVRLSVLRSAPNYLRDLKQARADLDHGWAALAVSPHLPSSTDPSTPTTPKHATPTANINRETFVDMKAVIEKQVHRLGKQLDAFLDMLEGRAETVPETWIEDFEVLEEQYGAWVVQGERKVLEGEWRRTEEGKIAVEDEGVGLGVEREHPQRDGEAVRTVPDDTKRLSSTFVGPMITTTSSVMRNGSSTSINTNTHTTTTGPTTTTITTTTSTPRSRSRDSSTSRKRSRHVPIIVDFSDPGPPPLPTELPTSTSRNPSPAPSSGADSNAVKKRAAFLNGTIDKNEALTRSKSPPIVRPFEHASNAFTRLFKRDGGRAQEGEAVASRSASTGSASGRKRSSSSKRGGGSARKATVESEDLPPAKPTTELTSTNLRTSQLSSSSSKENRGLSMEQKRSLDAGRMEYMDMVRIPDRRSSVESTRRSRSETPKKRDGKNSVEYGDMVRLPSASRRSEEGRRRSEQSARRSDQAAGETFLDYAKTGGGITALPPLPSAHKSRPSQTRTSKESARAVPETYKPTRSLDLSSPFHSPIDYEDGGNEFPPDWPLSQDVTPSEELQDRQLALTHANEDDEHDGDVSLAPQQIMDSDAFEGLFVQSLPTKQTRPVTARYATEAAASEFQARYRPKTAPPLQWNEKPAPDRSLLRTGSDRKTKVLDWDGPPEEIKKRPAESSSLPRPVSMVQEADEEGSESDTEIEDAADDEDDDETTPDNAAGYFGSAGKSVRSDRSTPSKIRTALQRSRSTPPISPVLLKLRIPESENAQTGSGAESGKDGLIRSASVTSIESFPRSRLKSIELPGRGGGNRRSSTGSIDGMPETPTAHGGAKSPMDYNDMLVFPSPPSVPARRSSLRGSPVSPVAAADEKRHRRLGSSPLAGDQEGEEEETRSLTATMTPLNKAMGKRPVGAPAIRSNAIPLQPGEDNFDRHVSEVLDRVHAPIKFRSRPGAETPASERSKGQYPSTLRAKHQPQSAAKNMTIAPADPSPKKSTTTSAEPEVKLYHLTTAGRSEPIKLFVRLVGENERVMVRVGGGWADLAEWLRQYAEHHGSRTVSDGGVQVQSAEPASAKRAFSGPNFAGTSVVPLGSSPVVVGAGEGERPRTRESWIYQPQPQFSMGDSPADSPSVSQRPTSRDTNINTPISSSRPSTADAASSRPQSRQANFENSSPASLAGPTGKPRGDLPEQKARWVEGMIEKAKKSAASGGREERDKFVGDMGRVGGTRRVIFRGGDAK